MQNTAQLPEKVGKYHIVEVVGEGAMDIVNVGYDPYSDNDVANKVCTGLDEGDGTRQRMARKLLFNEARGDGAPHHPEVLKVLDASAGMQRRGETAHRCLRHGGSERRLPAATRQSVHQRPGAKDFRPRTQEPLLDMDHGSTH